MYIRISVWIQAFKVIELDWKKEGTGEDDKEWERGGELSVVNLGTQNFTWKNSL